MKLFLFVFLFVFFVSCSEVSQKESSSSISEDMKKIESIEYDLPTRGIGPSITTDVKPDKPYTLAIIVKNTTNPYMVSSLRGVEKSGQDMGLEIISLAPATADSIDEQIRLVEDMIQKKVDGIIIQVIDSNGIMPAVRKARAANIPIVTIGTPAAEPTLLRTGVNYYLTGYEIGKAVSEGIGENGEILVLEGPPGAQNAIERLQGVKDAVAEYPNVKIAASQTANFKRTEGMAVAENLIQRYTDVKAIIGMNDEMALGAIQALKAAGMEDVLVAGFDGNIDAASAIKNGSMFITYNTDPFGSSYLAAVYLVEYLNDGTEPPSDFVPFPSAFNDPLITKENIDEYVAGIAWFNAE